LAGTPDCGIKLARQETGQGSPVLLLHCSAGSGGQWRRLGTELASAHRVIAPDLPGYGRTGKCRCRVSSGLGHDAEHLAGLLTDLDEPAHVVGHSYGGAVALKLAMRHPALVRSLTLIEPVLFHLLLSGTPLDRALLREVIQVSSAMAARLGSDGPESAMACFVDFWNGNGAWQALDAAQRDRLAPDVGQVLRNFGALFSERWPLDDLAGLSIPALAIMGTESMPAAQRITELLSDAIAGARLSLILGAGHMAPLTHEACVNPLIVHHLTASGAGHAGASSHARPSDLGRAA